MGSRAKPTFVQESKRVAVTSVSVTRGHTAAPHPSGAALNYTFYSQPSSLVMHPTHGVNTGGTKVRIGNAMLADVLRNLIALGEQIEPICKFDTIIVPATAEPEGLASLKGYRASRIAGPE